MHARWLRWQRTHLTALATATSISASLARWCHGRVAPTGSVASREHHPVPRVRGQAGRAPDLRPPGRPGREGPRPGRHHAHRRHPAAGARDGRRGVRPAPDLRPDDPGDEHRQRARLHDRPAQHAPLRAALHRDPGHRPDARPHRDHQGQRHHRHRVRRRDGARPHPGLGPQPGRRARAVQGLPPPRADPRRGMAQRGRPAPRRRGAGGDPPDRGPQRDAARRRGEHPARPARRASYRRRAGSRRRAARRRAGGAARGRPGRDPQGTGLRARGRRPRGDVARRRGRPGRGPAAGDPGDPAPADGAGGGRGRPPADVVRREHRRRDDDLRAGHPGPGRHHRRRARPRAQPRAHPVPRGAGLRLPPTAGDAHRQAARRRPHPAPAPRAPSTLVAGALDDSLEWLRPEATIDEVAAHLATYNLVAAPVVDEDRRLLGAVTVDDLLDHMLPANWRDRARQRGGAAS